jgi:hypothetical protein
MVCTYPSYSLQLLNCSLSSTEAESPKTILAARTVRKAHQHQDSPSSDLGTSPDIPAPSSKAPVALKLPMRVPLFKSSTENTLAVRNAVTTGTRLAAPSTNSITGLRHGAAVKSTVAKNRTDLPEGPKRILVQRRSLVEQCSTKDGNQHTEGNVPKGSGPQRVLVRPSVPSSTSKSGKRVSVDLMSTSSSVVPASRLPGPSTTTSRIANFARRPAGKIGYVPKPGGTGKKL